MLCSLNEVSRSGRKRAVALTQLMAETAVAYLRACLDSSWPDSGRRRLGGKQLPVLGTADPHTAGASQVHHLPCCLPTTISPHYLRMSRGKYPLAAASVRKIPLLICWAELGLGVLRRPNYSSNGHR